MELENIRGNIRDIDNQILQLSKRRSELAKMIGWDKAINRLPIRNLDIENNIINRYRKFALKNGMNPDYAEDMCRVLIKESIDAQATILCDSGHIYHIIILGNNKISQHISNIFSKFGHEVNIVDQTLENISNINNIKTIDMIIISVPISKTETIFRELDSICDRDILMLDVVPFKSSFISALKEIGEHRKICSINPMFDLLDQSIYNRNLIVCDCGSKEAIRDTISIFKNIGLNARIIPLEKYDICMSYIEAILRDSINQ